jgi:hypothetical protein
MAISPLNAREAMLQEECFWSVLQMKCLSRDIAELALGKYIKISIQDRPG